MDTLQKLAFREKYPEGKLKILVAPLNEQCAILEARVYLDKNDIEDCFISNAVSVYKLSEDENQFELAVSTAMSNALSDAGFGTDDSDAEKMENPTSTTEPSPFAPPPTVKKPVDPLPFIPEPPAQDYNMTTPVEDIVRMMTVDDAKRIIVDCGLFKGRTLAEVAVEKPASLIWYVNSYSGPNNILRAGAKKLLEASMLPEAKAS